MISLRDPDARRALRSVVQAIVALVVVGLVAWIIHLLSTHPDPLERIALTLCGIVGLGTLFYGAENVTRAVRFKAGAGGIEGSIGDEAAKGAAATAEAAVEKAAEIAEEGKP